MWRFVAKRLLTIIPILLGATFIVFFIMHLAPSDATMMIAPDATEAEREELREELGLNDPLLVRYFNFVLDLCKGNLGTSFKSGAPVMDELMQRIPYTVMLAVAASLLMLIVAIPLGVLAALKQNSAFDSVSMAFCLIGVAMPPFWIGLLLMLLFSVKFGVLPSSGADTWKCLIMPALTQCVAGMASVGRVTRSSMLEVIRQDYIRTARSKGILESTVIVHHAMKNAMLPTITAAGLQFGNLLCGGVITETIFAWPGVGRFLVNSITWRDTPCVLGCIVFFVISISVVNLFVDLLYGFVDPRIKAMYKKN